MTIQLIVYFLGVFALGLFHANLKEATGGGFWFVLAAIAYLISLRLIGLGLTKFFRPAGQTSEN